MNTSEDEQRHKHLLRQRAEEVLQGKQVEVSNLTPEDFHYLLHELQVHQAELAVQNEELRQAQRDLEEARDRFANLFHFAPAGYCTLSRKDTILEANQTLAVLLGVKREALIHRKLSEFVERGNQDQYYLYRQKPFEDLQRHICQIGMVTQTGEKIVIRLESIVAPDDKDKLWVMLSDITQQQRMEKEALEASLLREVQHRLTDQREQERLQVARDLHDGPVQGLVALTFALRGMLMDHPNSELAAHFESIQADLQEQIRVLRSYSTELRPPMLSRFGLEKTIRSHAEIFQEKHPNIHITLELISGMITLPETTSLALFRIYQEALNNIVKHNHRPFLQATIKLANDDHHVWLEIQDNGQGFSLPEKWIDLVQAGHLGLVGMRERAEAVGGQLEIYSQKGEGTRLVVRVPLDEARKTGEI